MNKEKKHYLLKIEKFQIQEVRNSKSDARFDPFFDVSLWDGDEWLCWDDACLMWDSVIGTQFDLSKLRKKIEKQARRYVPYSEWCYYFWMSCILYFDDFLVEIEKKGRWYSVRSVGTDVDDL